MPVQLCSHLLWAVNGKCSIVPYVICPTIHYIHVALCNMGIYQVKLWAITIYHCSFPISLFFICVCLRDSKGKRRGHNWFIAGLGMVNSHQEEMTRLDYFGSIYNMQQYSDKIKSICFFGQLDCYLLAEYLWESKLFFWSSISLWV